MKHYLSIVLRVLLAAAGIGYIAWSIDWVDRVEVRAGTVLPGGTEVHAPVLMRVVSGAVDPTRATSPLALQNNTIPQAPRQIILAPAQVNDADHYLLRPSILTTLRHARVWMLVVGLLLVAPMYPVQAYRWLLLLRARGLQVSYAQALKLTMVGCFFNYCMPGSTGGDVIKGYYAAKNTDRRADSIMTVVFDRVVGLLGLVALAGIVGLFMLDDPVARTITRDVWLGTAVLMAGAAVYFSRRLRRRTGIDWLMGKLPESNLLARLDRAAVAYADHKGVILATVALSVPVHLLLASSTAIAGYALGMDTRFGLLLTVIPVIFLSGAVPITPQGAGVWELLGRAMLLHPPMVTMNQIVAMLVMTRLYQLVYSMTGSIYLLRGDVHLHPEKFPATAAAATP